MIPHVISDGFYEIIRIRKRLKEVVMGKNDAFFMEKSIETAWEARKKGNHPFGAVIVDMEDHILVVGENAVVSSKDCTAHAELAAVRQASMTYDSEFLAKCTLYASTEPCPMCAGAIYWSNVRRVVYGLSQKGLYQLIGSPTADELLLSCKDVFSRGNKKIEVVGPYMEFEAIKVHEGFWNA
jgi:tRNA(Arg) A34 adenosine deaminase TadA